MQRYCIGIDTGGTYTDAAIIDANNGRVVATAKALTTKGDLTVGIIEAMDRVLGTGAENICGDHIALVCLSTTLATNAIVEGHGSAIAVVFIGFDTAMIERSGIAAALPGTRLLQAAGGHDYAGNEVMPLDRQAVTAFARSVEVDVEAFAVAAHYSVRNPAHEFAARDLIYQAIGRNCTLSSELAEDLDAPRRALTAALNARIIARVGALIAAVRAAMARLHINAELMIVKGDGALAPADAIIQRPIETILSGPAASVIGAKFLSGRRDFIMADIGGTTTDVAILENGWPKMSRRGAAVGNRRTLVRTVDIHTFGLGGDSEVDINANRTVSLGPRRVVPTALLAARYPQTIAMLEDMVAEHGHLPHAGRFALRPFGHLPATPPSHLLPRETELLATVKDKPVALKNIVFSPAAHRALDKLVGLGLLQISGFTPTDAAHVLQLQNQWSRQAAELGGALLLRWRRMTKKIGSNSVEDLAREVVEALVRRTAQLLITTLADDPLSGAIQLIDAVACGTGQFGRLKVALSPNLPIVAVGGPAPVYYPEIGRRLRCEVLLPAHSDVANAIGAGVGIVRSRVVVEITAPEPGFFRLHYGDQPRNFSNASEALACARELAETLARERAVRLGAHSPKVALHIDRVDIPNVPLEHGLISAIVVAESWGAPIENASFSRRTSGRGSAID
jgi:N-methylhydantoinase A/oxoprolinase/acetone carboxylase beta subunit